jgi:hypothetical protein
MTTGRQEPNSHSVDNIVFHYVKFFNYPVFKQKYFQQIFWHPHKNIRLHDLAVEM